MQAFANTGNTVVVIEHNLDVIKTADHIIDIGPEAGLHGGKIVEEGQIIESGQTLCVIEAMKLMNEVPSNMSGKILEILVENGEPVEFGQPLFRFS